jgi:hypothetical protein
VILFNLVYDRCTSSANGGAVSLNAKDIFASITDCTFLSCVTSTAHGGWIHFHGGSLQVLRCDFSDSRSEPSGAGVFAEWNISDTTSIRGLSCYGNTWYFDGSSSSTAADIPFERSNLTNNTPTNCGSAVTFEYGHSLRFHFCQAVAHRGSNCWIFRGPFAPALIHCLAIRSNDCTATNSRRVGLFSIDYEITIWDSVITDNKVNFVVDSDSTSSRTLTFQNSHFDTFSLSTTLHAVIATILCATDGKTI